MLIVLTAEEEGCGSGNEAKRMQVTCSDHVDRLLDYARCPVAGGYVWGSCAAYVAIAICAILEGLISDVAEVSGFGDADNVHA